MPPHTPPDADAVVYRHYFADFVLFRQNMLMPLRRGMRYHAYYAAAYAFADAATDAAAMPAMPLDIYASIHSADTPFFAAAVYAYCRHACCRYFAVSRRYYCH